MSTLRCRKHGKERLQRYLQDFPVYDAHGKLVKVEYECRPDALCVTNKFDLSAVAVASDGIAAPQVLMEGMQAQADAQAEMRQNQTPNTAKSRYYDLSRRQDEDFRKVCFVCGMDDHERSDCPNKFCPRCHTLFPAGQNYHDCAEPVAMSPFLANLPPSMRGVTDEMMANVTCLYCGSEGHFDCRPTPVSSGKQPSCSFCVSPGHHAWSCPSRPEGKWERFNIQRFGAWAPSFSNNAPRSSGSTGYGYGSGYGDSSRGGDWGTRASGSAGAGGSGGYGDTLGRRRDRDFDEYDPDDGRQGRCTRRDSDRYDDRNDRYRGGNDGGYGYGSGNTSQRHSGASVRVGGSGITSGRHYDEWDRGDDVEGGQYQWHHQPQRSSYSSGAPPADRSRGGGYSDRDRREWDDSQPLSSRFSSTAGSNTNNSRPTPTRTSSYPSQPAYGYRR
jgi:hypothetical protein